MVFSNPWSYLYGIILRALCAFYTLSLFGNQQFSKIDQLYVK